MKSNLSIIGLGTRSVNQLTLEALTILKKCDVCLILPITSEETELKLQELGIKNLVNLRGITAPESQPYFYFLFA